MLNQGNLLPFREQCSARPILTVLITFQLFLGNPGPKRSSLHFKVLQDGVSLFYPRYFVLASWPCPMHRSFTRSCLCCPAFTEIIHCLLPHRRKSVISAKDAPNTPLADIQMRPGLVCQHPLLFNTFWQMVLSPEGHWCPQGAYQLITVQQELSVVTTPSKPASTLRAALPHAGVSHSWMCHAPADDKEARRTVCKRWMQGEFKGTLDVVLHV